MALSGQEFQKRFAAAGESATRELLPGRLGVSFCMIFLILGGLLSTSGSAVNTARMFMNTRTLFMANPALRR